MFRSAVEFNYNAGVSASECYRRITAAHGEKSISLSNVTLYYRQLRAGVFSHTPKKKPGPRPTQNNKKIFELLDENPFLSTKKLSRLSGLSKSAVFKALKKRKYRFRWNQWTPRALTDAQFAKRCRVAKQLAHRNKYAPFLRHIVTGDEKWVCYDNTTRQIYWSPPGDIQSLPKPPAHQPKVLLCLFWNYRGPIHYEFLPRGKTVNGDVYRQQLRQLKAKIDAASPKLMKTKHPLLLHDNAKPHTAKMTVTVAKELGFEILPHPPYSPDIAPTDYHVFRSMQHFLADHIFDSDDELLIAVENFILSKPPTFRERGIFSLPDRWEKVISKSGHFI